MRRRPPPLTPNPRPPSPPRAYTRFTGLLAFFSASLCILALLSAIKLRRRLRRKHAVVAAAPPPREVVLVVSPENNIQVATRPSQPAPPLAPPPRRLPRVSLRWQRRVRPLA